MASRAGRWPFPALASVAGPVAEAEDASAALGGNQIAMREVAAMVELVQPVEIVDQLLALVARGRAVQTAADLAGQARRGPQPDGQREQAEHRQDEHRERG